MFRAYSGGIGKVRHGGRLGGPGDGGGLQPITPVLDADLYLLLHADGPNGLPMFYDSSMYDQITTPSGTTSAALDTSIKKFGSASAKLGGAATARTLTSASLDTALAALTTGDIAIQMWAYPTASAGITYFFDGRSGATDHPVVYQDATNLYFYSSGANRITVDPLPLNQFSFLEWSRVSGVSRLFVDGLEVGQWADTVNYINMDFKFGRGTDVGAAADIWYMDECRVITTGGNVVDYVVPSAIFDNTYTVTSTWNSADKAATVSLMNNDRVAYASANFGAVRGATSHNSGIHQFECVCYNDMEVLVGLSDAGADLTNYPGAVATSWGYYSANGNKYNNNSGVAYGAAWVAGDVIGVVYDVPAGELRFYKNGASQGAAYTGLSGAKFPIFGAGNNTAGLRSCKINTGQSDFLYPIGGATAWG